MKNLLRFIESTDFRYEDTLRINFNTPLGLGSYCDTVEELKDEFDYVYNELSKKYNDETLKKFINITDKVNNYLLKTFGDVILDWRDDSELEIHGVSEDFDSEDFG